uniref:Putative DNA ligase domain protein n=1 Tax=viral metagenome TaxID=1070528 RepID=A0A6M3M916_9ZZZZ
MPFAGYKDFKDCENKNQDKTDPSAFCAWLERKVASGSLELGAKTNPAMLYGLYRLELMAEALLGMELLTKENAEKALKGDQIWKSAPDAVVIDDHRWVHVWSNAVKGGGKSFLTKAQLRRLHNMIVDELARRRLDSGLHHKSPLPFGALKLGDKLSLFLASRKEFMLDPAFISLIGSSLAGKEDPEDLDVLIRASKHSVFDETIEDILSGIKNLDLVWDPSGPNGPYIPAYELWARPVENSVPMEPKYLIQPMSPIPPAIPTRELTQASVYSLFEDSYYVEPIEGMRLMIHRKENDLMAFDKDLEESDIPGEIADELLGLEDPKSFMLDGFLTRKNGQPVYYLIDMPWWRESEHINQTAELRRHFMKKLPEMEYVKSNNSKYFSNRADTVNYLKEEEGPFLLIPGMSKYPINGSADWLTYSNIEQLSLAQGADDQIKKLVDDGEWESKSADERFSLMTKRKKVEPLYPFAQLKTTKKGYSTREVFGIKSVKTLAEEIFKVPSKQATEAKIDGFRVQAHRNRGEVKLFTESGHEITHTLPGVVESAKQLPANSFVLDTEATPYGEDFMNLGRAAAAPAFAKGATKAVDDSRWALHVFDILYIDGEDIHNLPYEERRQRLRGIELPVKDVPKKDEDFRTKLWENNVNWATSAEQMIKFAEQANKVPGSEGAMFKQADSKYRLSGNTPLWSKMKQSYEIDALVVGMRKEGETYTYAGAIGPVTPPKEAKLETVPVDVKNYGAFVKYKGKVYTIAGNTFNTNIKAPLGGIIRVTVKDVRKIDDKAYHWFHPQVLEAREDKTQPDPLETAETISESAKAQQRVKKGAYLSNARFAEESSIKCCKAPWTIIKADDGGWIYLENNENLVKSLKELDVDCLYASAMDRGIANNLLEAGINFELTAAPTVADFTGRRTYLESDWPPAQVIVNGSAFSEFYSAVRSHPDFHMRLSCGAAFPIPTANIKKLADPYVIYPDEKGSWKYVIQFHIRGLSVHADFRAEINKNQLVGWTLNLGKSLLKPLLRRIDDRILQKVGLTKTQLKDMEIKEVSGKLQSTKDGKALMKQLSDKTQKLSHGQLKTLSNELWDEEVIPILEAPTEKILTQRKAVEPHEWLTYKGEVPAGAVGATSELEGVFIIMDTGVVEFGAQKPWFHEYFLEGKIKRKMVVRKIPTRKDWKVKQSFAWLTFFTKPGDMPYTISKRAVKQGWAPPQGISALPKSIRKQIPDNLQYWRAKNAKEIRDELVKEISKKEVTLKLAAGLQFTIKRVWHKGPEVRRGMPIVRYWLLLHDGEKVIDAWDFGKDADPTENLNILARRRDAKGFEALLKTTGEIPPNHPASYTKRLPNNFDTSDQGKATIISDENNMLRLRLNGNQLKGLYVLIKSDPGGDSWVFQKAELPEPKKAMLLQTAECETGYCTQTRIMKLSAKDFEYEKVGNLLFLKGPAIKPGEVIPMDGKPSYFTKEGIKRLWPSMYRQPIVVLHGDLKGDVIGFVDEIHYDGETGWGWVDRGIIFHPLGMKMILEGKLPAFSIEVIPQAVWDPEHQHDRVIGGQCVALAVVPKGACVTCNYTEATMGEIAIKPGQVYKFGMVLEDYLQEQYWSRGLSTQEIANREGIPRSTIESYMKQATIPRRSYIEARRLRSVREATVRKFGGRVVLTALGTGAYTDNRDDCPQCTDARTGGKSVRNLTASLFSVGAEHLLINAPPGISGMLGIKKLKPNYVLIEHIHEDAIGGLHELKVLKPAVFATAEAWDWLRKNYRSVSKQKGDFDDIYGFSRYVIKPGQAFALGSAYTVSPHKIAHAKKGDPDTLGFKIDLGDQKIWHGSGVLNIPDHKKTLGDVDIYVGDGSSLTRDVSSGDDYGHASMEKQIKWAQEAGIGKIYFTQIGHVELTHEELQKKLRAVAVNAEPLFDSMEIGIGGASAGAYHQAKTAQEILSGERKIIVRAKPYSEYARQVILLLDESNVHGLYIEGFPDGPIPAETVKEMKVEHLMADAEWKKEIGDADNVWVYHPRVLKRFDPPRKYNPVTPAGPYIHDVKMLN